MNTKWLNNKPATAILDLQFTGYKKFEGTGLNAFNKKIENMKKGIPTENEVNTIAPPNFNLSALGNDDDNQDFDNEEITWCFD